MGRVIEFEIAGERYTMFVTGILKRKYYLMRESDRSILADPIPVKGFSQYTGGKIFALAGLFTFLYAKKEKTEELLNQWRQC